MTTLRRTDEEMKAGLRLVGDALPQIFAAVGDRLTDREVAGILLTPQPALGGRTPAEAVLEGDTAAVVALLRHTVTEEDADAPELPAGTVPRG